MHRHCFKIPWCAAVLLKRQQKSPFSELHHTKIFCLFFTRPPALQPLTFAHRTLFARKDGRCRLFGEKKSCTKVLSRHVLYANSSVHIFPFTLTSGCWLGFWGPQCWARCNQPMERNREGKWSKRLCFILGVPKIFLTYILEPFVLCHKPLRLSTTRECWLKDLFPVVWSTFSSLLLLSSSSNSHKYRLVVASNASRF